jgi:Arc/MetJ-type ribon-helix-helix transcriptional regulator
MEHEQLVKALRAASPEKKGEVVKRAVRAILDKHEQPATASAAKKRWESYEADKKLSELVRAERESMLGKGY